MTDTTDPTKSLDATPGDKRGTTEQNFGVPEASAKPVFAAVPNMPNRSNMY